jgi:hypothetical protein
MPPPSASRARSARAKSRNAAPAAEVDPDAPPPPGKSFGERLLFGLVVLVGVGLAGVIGFALVKKAFSDGPNGGSLADGDSRNAGGNANVRVRQPSAAPANAPRRTPSLPPPDPSDADPELMGMEIGARIDLGLDARDEGRQFESSVEIAAGNDEALNAARINARDCYKKSLNYLRTARAKSRDHDELRKLEDWIVEVNSALIGIKKMISIG